MHRLSASGVQRQGALDARAKLAGPAGKEDEERDEKRLSKADRTARPTSSATFSTLSVIRERVEPGSKFGYVRYAAESGSKFRALMASPPGIAA
jgi:hypothetical protein